MVTWHSDRSGVTSARYGAVSRDDGATWDEPRLLEVAEPGVAKAWLSATFYLAWGVRHSRPHDTHIELNGHEVALLKHTVPEGTYVFPVPAAALRRQPSSQGGPALHVYTGGMNPADHVLSGRWRLHVQPRFIVKRLVAASQAEADALANRPGQAGRPDLVAAANALPSRHEALRAGGKINLPLTVHNLGAGAAHGVTVGVYRADPALEATDLGKAKLAEQSVGELSPGASATAALEFTFRPEQMARVWVAVTSDERDLEPADNRFALALLSGDSPQAPPVYGTDIPPVFQAPALLDVVQLPNLPAVEELLQLPDFGARLALPGLPAPDLRQVLPVLREPLAGAGLRVPDLGGLLR
jgi:hypothetical protein